jgi:hypothetical protein
MVSADIEWWVFSFEPGFTACPGKSSMTLPPASLVLAMASKKENSLKV